jgi:tetratricopeptide (TPR) repeat protein
MESTQVDQFVQRLVANPHDEEVLASAHRAGAADPKAYAQLLERVGAETKDPAYAAHWYSEAAHVWSSALGDAHRAARALMQAIDRDPRQATAAGRLAEMYRDKGDFKALVALLERRVKALTPRLTEDPELAEDLAAMHEELGQLWQENLKQSRKALENFRRSIELDPNGAFAIFSAREIYKASGQWAEAIELYAAELKLEQDPARIVALCRDEAETRKLAGDLAGASGALARARATDPDDPALKQEYASGVLDRIVGGEDVPLAERAAAAGALCELAEEFGGEHGLAYASGALDLHPGDDRALQLYAHYASELGQEDEVSARYLAYVQANPQGTLAADARWLLAQSYEAAGQPGEAIAVLEPLRALGDEQATAKLAELYASAGQAMPSVVPPSAVPEIAADDLESVPPKSGTSADKVGALLDAAKRFADAGNRPEACQKYREVLQGDPAHPEALAWVEDYLRAKRDFASLRDVLLAAVRAPGEAIDARKARLREVAGLCESNLRDVDGAIGAYRQLLALDRTDEPAHQALARLLEKAHRWDDLANLLEQEAGAETDLEKRIALEKKVAAHHEQKRKDPAAAGEAWERIAGLAPDDDQALKTASELYEKAGSLDRAAQVLAAGAPALSDVAARTRLLERVGVLREQLGDLEGAGEAYASAAGDAADPKLLEAAERCYVAAERWDRAGDVAVRRAEAAAGAGGDAARAVELARAAEHFTRAGDDEVALGHLERAAELDPRREATMLALGERYAEAGRFEDLAALLGRRAEHTADKAQRIALRRQIADLFAGQVGDKDAARTAWRKVLEDGEDAEALDRLIDDAVEQEDFQEATALLRRRRDVAADPEEKTRIALREAGLLAEGLDDVPGAVAAYETILAELDPRCRPALQAIADLEEAADRPADAAKALERELVLVDDPGERAAIGNRLARLYGQLDDAESAIRALDVVRQADADDFDALARLCDLCEKTEKWGRVAELLAQRVEIEADDAEMSLLTRRLSEVLAGKLDRGDEALAVLVELADQGDEAVREAYVALGDRLGWHGIVAGKLVEWWFEAKPGPERIARLRGAFDRFVQVARDADAVKVGREILRGKAGDHEVAVEVEKAAAKTHDLDAMSMAHDFLAQEVQGVERARELVRQAEARAAAGATPAESVQHGEAGLVAVPPAEVEEMLARLAALADGPGAVVDLYERQVSRCKAPADRAAALGRAAQVAAARGHLERARGFFDLALSAPGSDEVAAGLERAAREADEAAGNDALRRTLCAALAAGGQGARDGGRTRGSLLRRAAAIASADLREIDQAFTWLGDALIAHVEPPTLDALEELAREQKDMRRAEATLTRALDEVFDGPLVRQLLARRARLRRETLDDKPGAATDLKKLYELSPHDQALLLDLSALLRELGDNRGVVQLYEDQILRGKDVHARVDLARQIARIWEEEMVDPREAADAWRRVLRMKPGDPDATAGLERAKANMLRKADRPSEKLMASNLMSKPLLDDASAPALERTPAPVRGAVAEVAGAVASAPTPEGAPGEATPVEAPAEAEASAGDEPAAEAGASPETETEPEAVAEAEASSGVESVVTQTAPVEPPPPSEVTQVAAAPAPADTAPPPSEEDEPGTVMLVLEESTDVVISDAGAEATEDAEELELEELEEVEEKPKAPPKRSVPPPLPTR